MSHREIRHGVDIERCVSNFLYGEFCIWSFLTRKFQMIFVLQTIQKVIKIVLVVYNYRFLKKRVVVLTRMKIAKTFIIIIIIIISSSSRSIIFFIFLMA